MIYNIYYKWRISLPLLSQYKEVTEETLRKTFLRLIDHTLEAGQDPYEEARQAEVDGIHNWVTEIPQPRTEEEMSAPRNKAQLAEWMQTTEEAQEALSMFRNQPPKDSPELGIRVWEVNEDEVPDLTVYDILTDLIPMEGD